MFGSELWNNGKEKYIFILHRFAVCSWFKPKIPHSSIYNSVWSFTSHSRSTDNYIPVAQIAGAFVPAAMGSTGQGFQCLILPNQLTLWNPNDENEDLEADDADVDVDLTECV